jgi:hypothetical protein
MNIRGSLVCTIGVAALLLAQGAVAQEKDTDSQELAKKLTNPVASLISVPFQFNYDHDYGFDDKGEQFRLNIQPVIPISLGEDWGVISRTIAPIIYQDHVVPLVSDNDQFGLGDIQQSLFFSPKAPGPGGLIWGVGPVASLRTATDDLIGSGKWSVGPTGVALMQRGHWTIGVLASHLWSVGGNDDRADVNTTFMQPFIAYTTSDAWTFTLNSETTYDWEAKAWSVPVNAFASKLLKFGSRPVSIGAGLRYWAESPKRGPEGLGARVFITFLFPE